MTTARINSPRLTRRTQQTSAPERSLADSPSRPRALASAGGARELTARILGSEDGCRILGEELATARRAGTRTDPRRIDLIAIGPMTNWFLFVEVRVPTAKTLGTVRVYLTAIKGAPAHSLAIPWLQVAREPGFIALSH